MRSALGDQPAEHTGQRSLRIAANDLTSEVHALEWPAFPARIAACVGRSSALRLLDWQGGDGTPRGRIRHQEEYAEWRTVRHEGRLRTIELTTELPEYWEVLAGFAPSQALKVVAEFATADAVPTDAIYGEIDPFSATTSPAQRIEAFRKQMLANSDHHHAQGLISDFNNGRRALCCMVHRDNNLASLLRLIVTACQPFEDSRLADLRLETVRPLVA